MEEFLEYYLDYKKEEIDNLSISETSISAKGDAIMYVAFDQLEDLKEIHMRIAVSGETSIATRNFIPPQIYEIYASR